SWPGRGRLDPAGEGAGAVDGQHPAVLVEPRIGVRVEPGERPREPAVVQDLMVGLSLRSDRRAHRVAGAEQRGGAFGLVARRGEPGEDLEAHRDSVRLAELAGEAEALGQQFGRLRTLAEL